MFHKWEGWNATAKLPLLGYSRSRLNLHILQLFGKIHSKSINHVEISTEEKSYDTETCKNENAFAPTAFYLKTETQCQHWQTETQQLPTPLSSVFIWDQESFHTEFQSLKPLPFRK